MLDIWDLVVWFIVKCADLEALRDYKAALVVRQLLEFGDFVNLPSLFLKDNKVPFLILAFSFPLLVGCLRSKLMTSLSSPFNSEIYLAMKLSCSSLGVLV